MRMNESECPYCNAKVKHLKHHINRLHKVMELSCDKCGRTCKNMNQLHLHWNYVHKIVKDLQCNICNEPFQNRSKLRRHIQKCISRNNLQENDKLEYPMMSEENPIGSQNVMYSSEFEEILSDEIESNLEETKVDANNVAENICCNLCDLSFSNISNLKTHTIECIRRLKRNGSAKHIVDNAIQMKALPDRSVDIKEENLTDEKLQRALNTDNKKEIVLAGDGKENATDEQLENVKSDFIGDINSIDKEVLHEDNDVDNKLEELSTFKNKKPGNDLDALKMKEEICSDLIFKVSCENTKNINKEHIVGAEVKKEDNVDAKGIIYAKSDYGLKSGFACKLCRKILLNENRLKNHVDKIHKIEDKVVCEHCAKEMMSKNIKQHVRLIHGNQSNVESKCPDCGKTFPKKYLMLAHMKDVHAEEIGVCDICCKTFQNRKRLQTHIKTTHNTSIFYPCQHCNKQFKGKALRNNHIGIVHLISIVTCGFCNKEYKNKNLLGKHVRKYHR